MPSGWAKPLATTTTELEMVVVLVITAAVEVDLDGLSAAVVTEIGELKSATRRQRNFAT